MGVFSLGASLFTIGMSFTDWKVGPSEFVGLQNYIDLLNDGAFMNALVITSYFVLISIPVTVLVAIPVAYVIHALLRRTYLYRMVLLLPYVFPTVAAALVWQQFASSSPASAANWLITWAGLPSQPWLLDPRGVIQLAASALGLNVGDAFAGPSVAMSIVILVRIWQMLGFTVVVLLAGLTNMNRELIEAARVDGAGEVRILRSVVVPSLMPTIVFVSVISFIFTVREFNTVYVLTGGGPGRATETLPLLIFREFYENGKLGYAAAISTVLVLLVLLLTLIQLRMAQRLSRV